MTIKEALKIYEEILKPTKEETERIKKKAMLSLMLIGAIRKHIK